MGVSGKSRLNGIVTVLVEGGDDDSQHKETTDREQVQHSRVVVPPGVTRSDATRRWLSHESGVGTTPRNLNDSD